MMKDLIIVRGGGDLATGTIYKLKRCGFPVLILETANPAAIRRTVAFSEAVFQGNQTCRITKFQCQSEALGKFQCPFCTAPRIAITNLLARA